MAADKAYAIIIVNTFMSLKKSRKGIYTRFSLSSVFSSSRLSGGSTHTDMNPTTKIKIAKQYKV